MARKKQYDELRRRRKKRENRNAARDEAMRRPTDEFVGPFVERYQQTVERAKARHKSLLGIFECSDELFYEKNTNDKLAHFGLGSFRQVLLDIVGDLDFDVDPSAVDGIVNERIERLKGAQIIGTTSVVTDGSERRTLVFMRASTGGAENPETTAALKLPALFHEIGHVLDIENRLNFTGTSGDLVKAEAFAHHYACRELVAGRFRLTLGHYLKGIEELSESPSEYIQVAAKQVMGSYDWAKYKAEVSPFYSDDEAPSIPAEVDRAE